MFCWAAPAESASHFTVTADMRSYHSKFDDTCQAINSLVAGAGTFHVSCGDVDGRVWENRAVIDSNFGAGAAWYPVIGNHEEEDGLEMEWLRAEYDDANGSGVRPSLYDLTNHDGPIGTQRTTYTWDDPLTNTHYIALNEYWNGGPTEGTGTDISGHDTATDGDIVSALHAWLAADLAANRDKAVFVFGHEPAYPYSWQRHYGDSLDKYAANRDAFWDLLEAEGVEAYFCGHTHQYAKRQPAASVWQIDTGAAGNGDYETFVNVTLLLGQVRYDVYDNSSGDWGLLESWSEPANSIPEPATLGLLAAGAVLVLLKRTRLAVRNNRK